MLLVDKEVDPQKYIYVYINYHSISLKHNRESSSADHAEAFLHRV